MRSTWRFAAIFLLLLAGSRSKASDRTIFTEDFENGLRSIWQPVEFEGKTSYSISKDGTNSFLRARAIGSASGLAVKLDTANSLGASVSWKWKIDKIPSGGSDNTLKTFDHTARVFVAFKTLVGPPRTINYVWANNAPAGKTFEHPSSGRSRFIVLQSGNSQAGKWITENRDLANDWKMLFRDDDPPAIVGIGFMTDSDGTKTRVTGCYDDIRIATKN